MNGPAPVTPSLVADWINLTKDPLSREEALIILNVDAAYRNAWHSEERVKREREAADGHS